MRVLIDRLSEPSTWAGLSGIALVFGVSAEDFEAYAASAAGLCGFIAVCLGERRVDAGDTGN